MGSPEQRIRKIIAEQLSVSEDQITPEARFIEDLGADSLDSVELVMALEEEFGVEIPDQEAEKITSFRDVLEFIQQRQAPSAPPAGTIG